MTTDEELNQLAQEAIEKINHIISRIISSRENMELYDIGAVGRAGGLLGEFLKPIYERCPHLRPPPPKDYIPDPPMSEEQKEFVGRLSDKQLEEIDKGLLALVTLRYAKVAMIVAKIISDKNIHIKGIPDLFYAQRVRLLAEEGKLEAQGNLAYMRFSEVRLPH